MSTTYAAATRARLSSRQLRACHGIARRSGAEWVYTGEVPGQLVTGWFAHPNRGFPDDRDTRGAIVADLCKFGLASEFGLDEPST